MKIATKINFTFSAVVVVLVSISLFVLYTTAKSDLQEAIYAHLSTTAFSRAHHIETFLEKDKLRLRLLAESDWIEDIVSEIIHNAPNLKESSKDLSLILKDCLKTEEEAYELFVLNQDGKVIASTDEGSIGADESTEVHFLKGKDRAYIRDAYYGKSGRQEYSVSAPIRDDDSKTLLGIIVGRFKMAELNEILIDRTGLGETGEIYLVNKFGYTITPSRFIEDTFLKQEVNTVNFRMSVGRHEKTQTGYGPTYVFPDYRGVSVLGTHAHIAEMQWSLLAEIDEEEALMPMTSMKYIFVVILCAVPVIMWIVGTVLSNAITSPLNKLQKGTETIGTGDLNIQFEIESNDEVGKLAQSFNEMTGKLKAIRDEAEGLNYQLVETTARANDKASQCKKAEEALRESASKYRILYEDSRDAIMMNAPPTWRFIAGNQATIELFGARDEEEFMTKGPWDVSPEYQPDGQLSAEKAKDMIEKAMKEGSNFFEWQHKKLDGKEFHATVLLTRLDLDGRELLQATVRDITEYKQTLESLLKSETKYRTLVENIPQKVFVKDRNSVYVSCNDSYAEALKIKASDIIGKTDYDFFPKELAEKYRTDDKRIIESEKTESIEEKYDHHGEEIFINTVKTPVKDDQGHITGLLGIFWDITERKRAEGAIKTAYEQLEQSNRELKEMQSQLVQNEKLASIGQLAAGVAHEMNTPVGFVASNFKTLENYTNKFLELLAGYKEVAELVETGTKEQRLTKLQEIAEIHDTMKIDFILEDIQGLFDDSREGLDRVTSIVQNLRDFSRIDQPGSRDKYNINEGIKATLVVARNEIKYDADIKTDFSEVPPIFCHTGQINQVFLNILMNATQAIRTQERDGNGTIAIRTYATETGVVCEIEDDGSGIPPEILSKVFDPFFTTKPVGKGTGLGLSVSYDIIVNKHNGKLLVDSKVGEGTKFTIKLPISTKENNEQEIINDGKENSIICGR